MTLLLITLIPITLIHIIPIYTTPIKPIAPKTLLLPFTPKAP